MSEPSDLGGLGALMGNLLKEAQSRAKEMEARASERTVTGESGGGLVKVTVSGKMEITAVVIERDAIDPNDPEMLGDLVMAAANQALRAARDQMSQEALGLVGGMSSLFPGR